MDHPLEDVRGCYAVAGARDATTSCCRLAAKRRDLPSGEYTVHIWHPQLDESGPQLSARVHLADGNAGSVSLRLTHALRPAPQHHGADKKWADY